ncbi:MAG: methylated-DNA--[protein]-cysteine S-methyltransferase [Candidatus Andersenbacteria bacterium]
MPSINGTVVITYGIHPSPFGSCLIGITEQAICTLAFLDTNNERVAIRTLRETWPAATLTRDQRQTESFVRQLFGRRRSTRALPIILKGTNFQIKVWEALLTIPAGKVVSYSTIAKRIGSPKAARAVGAACGANPVGFIVPCHRVLSSNGTLGGYHWGIERKRAMLAWEHTHIPA